ncbi:MAG: hypothetical protein PHP44_15050 [Kiritimatiellae bacterium]|nr:hypothetical protein [Kiritimatiellia bacterium]MDD4737413.1 hypothetical protein [Kiritimatiellia bacterium]
MKRGLLIRNLIPALALLLLGTGCATVPYRIGRVRSATLPDPAESD